MKIENQVVSLELAKKMKELGFEQESAFYWRNAGQVGWQLENEVWMRNKKETAFSAYTVAELGEMLPRYFEENKSTGGLMFSIEGNGEAGVGYMASGYEGLYSLNNPDWIYGENEADARAKMLIFLRTNNLI